MTNPISGDNFLAHQAAREQKAGADAPDKRVLNSTEARTDAPEDRVDVGRAHRRLSQETEGTRAAAVRSADEAQGQIARLKALLAADPQAALGAHGRVDSNLFGAAMARPTA